MLHNAGGQSVIKGYGALISEGEQGGVVVVGGLKDSASVFSEFSNICLILKRVVLFFVFFL